MNPLIVLLSVFLISLLTTKFVAVLIVLIALISRGTQKAYQGNADKQLKKIEPLGKLTLIIGLMILIIAVNVFH